MHASHQTVPVHAAVRWTAVALALVAALAYWLIGWQLLAVGDLGPSERPAAIIYVAAACYLGGGLLILAGRRWLWLLGAIVNALVIIIFVSAYAGRPAVLLSPGGLATKAAQLLLEAALIYLLVADRRR